jgi:drug/metabolite transporter (DMT)-like permease
MRRRFEARVGSGRAMPGVAVAAVTALISGVAVFVNGYGVHDVPSPAVYTTAKNLVAAAVLAGVALAGRLLGGGRGLSAARRFVRAPGDPEPGPGPRGISWRSWGLLEWFGLAYVGVVGGGLAFVLYFEALAKTAATPAAFWHDTLVVWVALLAYPVLRERVTWWNVAAVCLLVVGQVTLVGGVGHLGATSGEMLALSATVLWAIEVVVAKLLLRRLAPATLSVVRMGVGAAALVVYLAASGNAHALVSLTAGQVGWALVTGLLLAGYVGTWMTALSRARALDVTSVLVLSAVVTWLLQAAAGSASLSVDDVGLLLVAVGAGTVAWMVRRRPARLGAGDEARGG